jgi:hypothetical protein
VADLNRYNPLGAEIGENPLHMPLHEHFLKFLIASEAKSMVQEIGRWKEIEGKFIHTIFGIAV